MLTMLAEKYQNLMKKHQQEITDFPIAYAFNKKQLEEALIKLNADISEVVTYMDMGDIMKRSDVPKFKEMLHRHTNELYDLLCNDKEAAEEAILYEMNNHEYCINWDADNDVLRALCLDYDKLKEFGLEDAYHRARKEHMRIAHEDWEII